MRCSFAVAAGLLLQPALSTLQAQQPAPGAAHSAGAPAAQAPAGTGEIRGTIVEGETSAPVPRASVSVRAANNVLVSGAIANERGAFALQGLRPGIYHLRITSLGFSPRLQDVTIAEASPKVMLPPVKLMRVAVSLQGITSVAVRDAMTIEPDRNAYRAKDVAPAAANASEVLENVPAVQVDADGKVSYRGNENVVVQINGRPTPMHGPQLASYLKSLPASILDRVEVIPNPSAKYDPEGMAGIINIQLKQQVDLGLSAGATLTAANADRYSGSGNLGYQAGPWTSMITVGRNVDERDVVGVNDRERLHAGQTTGITNQDLAGRNAFAGTNVGGNAEYRLSARDALSATAAIGQRSFRDTLLSTYNEFDAARALLDVYDRSRDAQTTGSFYDASGGFRRTWNAKMKHELYTELRFTQNDDRDNTSLWRIPPASSSARPTEGELDNADARQRQLVAQLDYTKVLANRRKLEAGYKGTGRFLDRDFRVVKDSAGNGTWLPSALSNSFRFDERVEAVYGVYSQGIGKVDLQGGLRAEYATREFTLASKGYPFHYGSLFPSAAVTFNPSDAFQYKASYSRRIRRPGSQELNPFPQFFDAQIVFLGNPDLNPEYTDAWELGATRNGKFGSLQLSPFFRRTSNVISAAINTADTVDGRDVTTVSFRNGAYSNSYGSDLNANLRLGQKLNAFGGVSAFKIVTDGGSTSVMTSNIFTWMGRLNVTSQVAKNTTVQGSYMYRAPSRYGNGEFSAMQMANFSVRQNVNGDRGSVTLRVVDPFNTQKMTVRVGDANLTQLTSRNFGARAVFVSYQYSYGRPPRIRARQDDQPQQQGPGFP